MNTLERLKRLAAPTTRLAIALLATIVAGSASAAGEPSILDDAYLWLDASTLTGSAGDEVASWASRNEGGKTASTTGTKPTIAATQLNGMNVVDFGAAGSGMDLTFDRTATIRTVFMVADVANNSNVFLLGDSGNYNFHRGSGGQYFYDYGTDALVSGTYRNGVKVDAPRSTVIPTGFGLITLVANANVAASRICQDRTQSGRNGGKKIAELIIFNKTLSAAERRQVDDYLMGKWLGYCNRSATVSANTTWSGLVWDKSKPDSTPDSLCTYTINVTDNATLDLDSAAIEATSITFNIASDKTLTLNGTATITGTNISVVGSGKLKLNTSNPGCAIIVESGSTMDVAVATVSCAITNNGTINADGCTFNGAMTCNGTINTSGVVSFSGSVQNKFYSGSRLIVVSGTTTCGSSSNQIFSDGYVEISKGATLVNNLDDMFNWNGTVHVHVKGTLTMSQKATIGANNYLHLYDGALIDGSAANALYFNTGEGDIIAEEGTSKITAAITKSNGTIKIETKEGAVLELPSQPALTKTGTGTIRLKDQPFNTKITGSQGVVELVASANNVNHNATGIPFSGTVRVISENSKCHGFLWTDSASAGMFSGRPALDASSEIRLYNTVSTYPLQVCNLSGTGTIRMGGGTSSGYRYVDTLQTVDTTFSGQFTTVSGYESYDSALKVSGSTELHSLTLTANNTTTGPLDIDSNGKVVFSSTGKWSGGSVVVKNGGVLESQNSAAIAATLKVEEGATLKFADGVPLAATAFDWTEISNDASIKVDLSAIAPSATPVMLIASGVTISREKFTVAASQTPATLSVENGALKATFANVWRDGAWGGTPVSGDATLYISQNSTLTVSEALSLGTVTVVKEGEGNVILTISGPGELSTGGWIIPDGVTVNTPTSMTISGSVSGGGVLNIPVNATLAMSGVTCSTKVTVAGTLETSGTTTLSAANTSAAGSLIHVVSDIASVRFDYSAASGDITIDAGAELSLTGSAGYCWSPFPTSATTCIDVSGTLNIGDGTLYMYANATLKLRSGALIKGSGGFPSSSYGAILWYNTAPLYVYGNSEIRAKINTRSGTSPIFNVDEDATLAITEAFIPQNGSDGGGSITKTGAGTLDLTAITTLTKPLTINAGVVSAYSAPTATFLVNENGVFELKNKDIKNNCSTENYSTITGSGTIRYTAAADGSSTNWRTLQATAANRPANTLVFENNVADGLIFTEYDNNTPPTIEIGSLKGNGMLRSDWSGGENSRNVRINQSKDTTWTGTFHATDRFKTFYVTGGGTLTWNDTKSNYAAAFGNELEIENTGVVNLTGNWKGDVTVALGGTIGGTGTVSAGLTLNAGSTFKAWATDSNGLAVSGSLTLPASGYVNVDVSDVTLSNDGTTIMSLGSAPPSIDTLSCDHAVLKLEGTAIKAYPAVASVTTTSGTKPYQTLNAAIIAARSAGDSLQYISILTGDQVSVTPYAATMNIKNIGGAEINIDVTSEYTVTDSEGSDGVTAYTVSNNSTEYTWTGDATTLSWDAGTSSMVDVPNPIWSALRNWKFGDEPTFATRVPTSCDSVIFDDDASVVVDSNVTVENFSVDGAVTLSAESSYALNVTDGIVLISESATLEIGGSLSLDAVVTTTVENKCVTCVDNGSSITYSVGEPAAQIVNGDVFDTLANAIAAAENGNEVVLLANASASSIGKTITLDIGAHELTLTAANALDSISSLKGTGTLVVPSAALPTSALQTLLKNSNWRGTVALSGLTANTATQNFNFSNYGNAYSKIQLTNCAINYLDGSNSNYEGCLVLCDNAAHNPAFVTGNGYSDKYNKVGELKGNGSISATGGPLQMYCFLSAPDYTGSITIDGSWDSSNKKYNGRRIVFGNPPASLDNSSDPASIRINSGVQVGLGEGAAWRADYGIYISGTIIVNGNANLTSNHTLDHEGDNPKNLRGDKYIVFYDGAKLLYKKLCTITTTGDVTLAEASTVAVALDDGVSPVADTRLIAWSAAPAGTFAFDDGNGGTTQTLAKDGVTYLLSSESDGLYLRKAVAFTYTPPTTYYYYPSVAAALLESDLVYLYDAPNETVTLSIGKTIDNTMGKDVSNLVVNAPTSEYVSPLVAAQGRYSVANATHAAATYYWNGETGAAWGTRGNWLVGAADGPAATRDLEQTDSVVFNNGASVSCAAATVRCAGMTINGNVTLTGANGYDIALGGNITGTGVLTLNNACLKNSLAEAITVANTVEVLFTEDSEIAASQSVGITFNGPVSISGTIKAWDAVHTVAGTTTLSGNFTKSGGGFELTLGNVVVSASTTPTISAGTLAINGTVNVSGGATFTIPASGVNVGNAASFVLAGAGSVLESSVAIGEGKVTTSETAMSVIKSVSGSVETYLVGIANASNASAGYVENTTAVITNTSAAVTVPASVTALDVVLSTSGGASFTLPAGSAIADGNITIYASNENGTIDKTYNLTSFFTKSVTAATPDAAGSVSIALNAESVRPAFATTSVTVGEETKKPFVVSNSGVPTFAFATIPGFWYAVGAGDSVGSLVMGTPVKASAAGIEISSAAPGASGVKYYKLAVGSSKSALTTP